MGSSFGHKKLNKCRPTFLCMICSDAQMLRFRSCFINYGLSSASVHFTSLLNASKMTPECIRAFKKSEKSSPTFKLMTWFFASRFPPSVSPVCPPVRNLSLVRRGRCRQAKSNMFAFLRPSPFCYSDPQEEHKYPPGSCLSRERRGKTHLTRIHSPEIIL